MESFSLQELRDLNWLISQVATFFIFIAMVTIVYSIIWNSSDWFENGIVLFFIGMIAFFTVSLIRRRIREETDTSRDMDLPQEDL